MCISDTLSAYEYWQQLYALQYYNNHILKRKCQEYVSKEFTASKYWFFEEQEEDTRRYEELKTIIFKDFF